MHDTDAPTKAKHEVIVSKDKLQVNLSSDVLIQALQRAGNLIKLYR
jgi:hypothetical protein